MGQTNFDKRLARYMRDAENQTIHVDTMDKWPRRWILFGPRMIPVLVYIRSQARLHSNLQKKVNRAMGEKIQAERRLARRIRLAEKTQSYIVDMKRRIQEGADAGMTIAEWLEQDRARARAYWHR